MADPLPIRCDGSLHGNQWANTGCAERLRSSFLPILPGSSQTNQAAAHRQYVRFGACRLTKVRRDPCCVHFCDQAMGTIRHLEGPTGVSAVRVTASPSHRLITSHRLRLPRYGQRSSILTPKCFAIARISGNDGIMRPRSMREIVDGATPTSFATSTKDSSLALRSERRDSMRPLLRFTQIVCKHYACNALRHQQERCSLHA